MCEITINGIYVYLQPAESLALQGQKALKFQPDAKLHSHDSPKRLRLQAIKLNK